MDIRNGIGKLVLLAGLSYFSTGCDNIVSGPDSNLHSEYNFKGKIGNDSVEFVAKYEHNPFDANRDYENTLIIKSPNGVQTKYVDNLFNYLVPDKIEIDSGSKKRVYNYSNFFDRIAFDFYKKEARRYLKKIDSVKKVNRQNLARRNLR